MLVYTVKFSAPEPVSDEARRAFQDEALKLWQALIEGRRVIVSTEKHPDHWPIYQGNFAATPPIGCACETGQEVNDV